MSRDEFIKTACKMGYCTKKIAEEYSEGKDTLTEDDFIEVYRIAENQVYKNKGIPLGDGAYTKRQFYRDGGSEGNR
jgi:hypothetical protein